MINYEVFKMDFKRSLKSLIIWTLSVSAFVYLIIVLYPLVKDMYDNIPPELLGFIEMFGGLPKNVVEYFAVEGGMTLQIAGAIFAALLGFNMINSEERYKHSELVYTLPVSRQSFFYTKLLNVLVQILIYSLVVMVFTIFGFITVGSFTNRGNFFLYTFMSTLMLVMIGALGFSLACMLKTARSPITAMILIFPLYILYILSMISTNKYIEFLRYFTLFSFGDPTKYLNGNVVFEGVSFGVYLVISISGLIYSYFLFIEREFYI